MDIILTINTIKNKSLPAEIRENALIRFLNFATQPENIEYIATAERLLDDYIKEHVRIKNANPKSFALDQLKHEYMMMLPAVVGRM